MAGEVTPRRAHTLDRVWAFLRHPAVVISLALLLLLLLATTQILPQAPGQTQDDPAAAQRWINAESDRWGWAGPVMGALNLFSVGQSPFYFMLLAALLVIVSVHLADAVQRARLPSLLTRLLTASGVHDALPIATPDPVERLRMAMPCPPIEAVAALHETLAANVGLVQSHVAGSPNGSEPPSVQERMLATSRMRAWWLRALAPLGALMLLIALWAGALWGWNVQSPLLAPGDSYAWPQSGVTMMYTETVASGTVASGTAAPDTLRLRAGDDTQQMAARAGAGTIGNARVVVSEDAPAIWVATSRPLLQQPGEIDIRSNLGLVFPQPGSEQVVVLPGKGAGIRIIRLGDAPVHYLVEVFAVAAEQPAQRIEISEGKTITIPLSGEVIDMRLLPAPALEVEVRETPLRWLYIPALILILAGFAGYLFKPRYALLQIEPWPEQRSSITLQSNHAPALEATLHLLQKDSVASGPKAGLEPP